MENERRRARRLVAGCAVYMAAAVLLTAWDFMLPLVFAPLVGLICTAESFAEGRCYQLSIDMNAMEQAGGKEPVVNWEPCEACNGTEFRVIAGRLVCNTCGEVMEVDHGAEEA